MRIFKGVKPEHHKELLHSSVRVLVRIHKVCRVKLNFISVVSMIENCASIHLIVGD